MQRTFPLCLCLIEIFGCQAKVLFKQESGSITPSAGNEIGTFTRPDEYHMTVDVTLNTLPNNGWYNILYLGDIDEPFGDIWMYGPYLCIDFDQNDGNGVIRWLMPVVINKVYHIDLRVTQNSYHLSINGVHKQSDINFGTHTSGVSTNIYVSRPNPSLAADCSVSNLEIRDDIEESLEWDYIYVEGVGDTIARCIDHTWTPVYCSGVWEWFEDSNGYSRMQCYVQGSVIVGMPNNQVAIAICIKITGTNSIAITHSDSAGININTPIDSPTNPTNPTKPNYLFDLYQQFKFEVFFFIIFPIYTYIICAVFWSKNRANQRTYASVLDCGATDIVKLLLDFGADLVDSNGNCEAFGLARKGKKKCAEVIEEHLIDQLSFVEANKIFEKYPEEYDEDDDDGSCLVM